jgi:hypothetical protein
MATDEEDTDILIRLAKKALKLLRVLPNMLLFFEKDLASFIILGILDRIWVNRSFASLR